MIEPEASDRYEAKEGLKKPKAWAVVLHVDPPALTKTVLCVGNSEFCTMDRTRLEKRPREERDLPNRRRFFQRLPRRVADRRDLNCRALFTIVVGSVSLATTRISH